jgi:hypothetical protein
LGVLQCVDLTLKLALTPRVVGVEERNIYARGYRDAFVACG